MSDVNNKLTGGISIHGGGVLKVIPIDPVTFAQTTPWVDIGTIQTFDHKDDTTVKKEPDETGNTAAMNLDVREVIISGLVMESNDAVINFFLNTVGKFYQVYKYNGIVNSLHQEIWYGIGVIIPKIDLTSGVKRIPFEIHLLNNTSAIVINHTTGLPQNCFYTTLTDITIPANGIYTITES